MSDSIKKFLIDTGIGFVLAALICLSQGLFRATAPVDTFRILCDGFFAAGALLLFLGLLQWTKNGGVMDGLGFAFKTGFARIKRDFETAKLTFADYQRSRAQKATTPKYLLLAGLTHLVIAIALYAVYSQFR